MLSFLPSCRIGAAARPQRWRRGVVALVSVAVLLLSGCDFLALTDEQLVKNKIREHAEAVTAGVESRDWRTAASFYDLNIVWQQGATTLKGRDAARGFLASINEIQGVDEFFTIVNSIAKVNPELIEAKVTFQAHIVISSAELNYSNRFWDGRMGWVKRGPGKWQISYIVETTARQDGKFSRI